MKLNGPVPFFKNTYTNYNNLIFKCTCSQNINNAISFFEAQGIMLKYILGHFFAKVEVQLNFGYFSSRRLSSQHGTALYGKFSFSRLDLDGNN